MDSAQLFDAAADTLLGDKVELRCRLRLRARDTMVVFEQWLISAETNVPLARADVVCLCTEVDGSSAKMVAAPPELRARLAEWID